MNRSSIIDAIEAHAARFNLKPSTIGQLAVKNRHIHANLTQGADIQIGTAQRLLDWISLDAAKREGSASDAPLSEAS